MKAAFTVWNDRIAPVFDVAGRLYLLEMEAGAVVAERQIGLPRALPMEKALSLQRLGIEELVCGAISRSMEIAITTRGIHVIPFVAGDFRRVVQAWLDGTLQSDRFAMPGCCGRWKQHFEDGTFINREDLPMNGKGQGGGMGGGRGGGMGGGMGGGGGRGQGPSGAGRGRMGGPAAAGPEGLCVCPKCGRKEPHQRGVPCNQLRCPECGVAMIRQA
ncbi:MAG: hypothetical protein GX751_08455 [Desulfuromonadaceae bacterium]|nr:hypothetical protein [Desulfuromonadaceae bacterium]